MAIQRIPPGSITNRATISYISPMEDTQTRQQQQRRIWHFSCACSLCTEENVNLEAQKHSLACMSEGCEGGRPIPLGAEEDIEKQLEDKVCTDVVDLEESEDFEDVEVVVLVEVDDSDDAEVKVERNNIEIVEVDCGKENSEDEVEITKEMPGSFTGALPCWLCGEATEVGEQVRGVLDVNMSEKV